MICSKTLNKSSIKKLCRNSKSFVQSLKSFLQMLWKRALKSFENLKQKLLKLVTKALKVFPHTSWTNPNHSYIHRNCTNLKWNLLLLEKNSDKTLQNFSKLSCQRSNCDKVQTSLFAQIPCRPNFSHLGKKTIFIHIDFASFSSTVFHILWHSRLLESAKAREASSRCSCVRINWDIWHIIGKYLSLEEKLDGREARNLIKCKLLLLINVPMRMPSVCCYLFAALECRDYSVWQR